MSFQSLLKNQQITERLLQIKEGKNMSWEQVAQALYQILDDIDTEDDHCKEDSEAFRKFVMQHQARKNQFMASHNGQTVVRVNEENLKALGREHLQDLLKLRKVKLLDVTREDSQTIKVKFIWKETGEKEEQLVHWSVNESMTDWARNELQLAGLFDKDSDYEGMIGEAVIGLIEKFAEAGHSGFSAGLTAQLFDRLVHWKPLTELTNDPSEWNDVTEMCGGGRKPLTPTGTGKNYQSKRSPSCFSEDGGLTYYDQDECVDEGKEEDGATHTMFNPAKIVSSTHTSKRVE